MFSYDHSCWGSHASYLPSQDPLVYVTVRVSVALFYSQTRLLAQTCFFSCLSSLSIVFPICQRDYSNVVNWSIHGCHGLCTKINAWKYAANLRILGGVISFVIDLFIKGILGLSAYSLHPQDLHQGWSILDLSPIFLSPSRITCSYWNQ